MTNLIILPHFSQKPQTKAVYLLWLQSLSPTVTASCACKTTALNKATFIFTISSVDKKKGQKSFFKFFCFVFFNLEKLQLKRQQQQNRLEINCISNLPPTDCNTKNILMLLEQNTLKGMNSLIQILPFHPEKPGMRGSVSNNHILAGLQRSCFQKHCSSGL